MADPGGVEAAGWPRDPAALVAVQRELAQLSPPPWRPPETVTAAGCFVCFPRGYVGPGAAGDPAWAAAVLVAGRQVRARSVVQGAAAAPYEPGLLALREGFLLEAAVRALATPPDVLLVDATGRDHPRRAGLAVHLGAVLEIPTIGVTHRPLLAEGQWPPDQPGAAARLLLGGEVVAYWLRTRAGRRPLAVHAGWRVDPVTAVEVVRRVAGGHRTPQPLREARRLARHARASTPGVPRGQIGPEGAAPDPRRRERRA